MRRQSPCLAKAAPWRTDALSRAGWPPGTHCPKRPASRRWRSISVTGQPGQAWPRGVGRPAELPGCVHHVGCPASNHNFATIQNAVNAAAGNNAPSPTKDRILVGPGTYSNFTANSGNPVEVAGSGPGTVVARPTANADSTTVVSIGDTASEMHDAVVRMAIGSGDGGVNSAGTLTRVRVFAPGAETNGVGVFGGVVRDSSVSVPGTATGVSSATLVQRTDISANVGVDESFVFGTASL